jgi:hypothetical protein
MIIRIKRDKLGILMAADMQGKKLHYAFPNEDEAMLMNRMRRYFPKKISEFIVTSKKINHGIFKNRQCTDSGR